MCCAEPAIVAATVREGFGEWLLEGRMSDGQKRLVAVVDYGFEDLAHRIAEALSSPSIGGRQARSVGLAVVEVGK